MTGRTVHWSYGAEKLISYLPLSHVAAQIVDIYIPLVFGTTIYFAKPDALKVSETLWRKLVVVLPVRPLSAFSLLHLFYIYLLMD